MTSNDWLAAIEAMLSDALGFEATSIGTASVHASIRSAYLASGFDDPLAFVAALQEDDARRQALFARVVVPETWFFRDETPFTFLKHHAWQWARRHPAGRLRVLSAPCASGEEAYSIAITLLEAGLPPERFAVDAVDVSEPLLEHARRGTFQAPAFRKCPPAVQNQYFTACEAGFQLQDSVRASVTFTRCNLVGASVRLPAPHYDVVFCRNLLIYLHRDGRQALIRLLSGALTADGVLIVGHAEVMPMCEGSVFSVADGRAFALVRAAQVVRVPIPAAAPARPVTRKPAPPRPVAREVDPFERARALADRGQLDEARQLCERLLAERGPSAQVYFLLGVIDHAAGRHQQGAEALRKAIYLDPTHREALLQLAAHHERRGDRSSAARLRRRAEHAVE